MFGASHVKSTPVVVSVTVKLRGAPIVRGIVVVVVVLVVVVVVVVVVLVVVVGGAFVGAELVSTT